MNHLGRHSIFVHWKHCRVNIGQSQKGRHEHDVISKQQLVHSDDFKDHCEHFPYNSQLKFICLLGYISVPGLLQDFLNIARLVS